MAETEDNVLDDAGFDTTRPTEKKEPIYRVYIEGKIPVSKAHGKTWKSRRDAAEKQRNGVTGSWDECFRYFNNDQTARRNNLGIDRRDDTIKPETENVIYSNAATLLPSVYARNPKIDISVDQSDLPEGEEQDDDVTKLNDFALVLQRLVNKLISAQYLNLKPKARRAALFATLTNYAWLKLDWCDKEFSSDDVQQELASLAEEYAKAKTPEDVAEIEGKLAAIEQRFDVVSETGPSLVVKNPKDILIDPACHDASDLSSAKWVMEDDYLPTAFLRAVYMKKTSEGDDDDEYAYLYKPSHVAEGGEDANDDTSGMRFINWSGESDKDKDKYDPSYYTKVTYVWDKVTRRVFLYNSEDWSWPLWVWEDPLQLSRFFPYFGLSFSPSTTNVYAKGEVTYYLDQQDALNVINAQAAKVRKWAFEKFLYNKNIIKASEVDAVIKADQLNAIGIDIPEGMKVSDFFASILPPSSQHPELFNKDAIYKSIDRLSAVSDAQRGAQFKTNTTQDAVQMYGEAARIRIGEKIDSIEDMLADLGRSLAELCASKFDTNDVTRILSERDAAKWQQMSVRQFNASLTCSVAVGSTEKPTSANKQQQAIQTGQVLGQFAAATPQTLIIVLRMLRRAFDNVIISDSDLAELEQTLKQAVGAGGEDQNTQRMQTALQALLQVVPPQVKSMIEQAVQSGADPIDAIDSVIQQVAPPQQQ